MLLKAVNAAPPEDVGGASGYANFVAAMTDPDHPEHASMQEWYGNAFHPGFVDINGINVALSNLKI